ncbi:MAG: hypothetical protein ACQEP1_05685 [Nanobdellota archaeon]
MGEEVLQKNGNVFMYNNLLAKKLSDKTGTNTKDVMAGLMDVWRNSREAGLGGEYSRAVVDAYSENDWGLLKGLASEFSDNGISAMLKENYGVAQDSPWSMKYSEITPDGAVHSYGPETLHKMNEAVKKLDGLRENGTKSSPDVSHLNFSRGLNDRVSGEQGSSLRDAYVTPDGAVHDYSSETYNKMKIAENQLNAKTQTDMNRASFSDKVYFV